MQVVAHGRVGSGERISRDEGTSLIELIVGMTLMFIFMSCSPARW